MKGFADEPTVPIELLEGGTTIGDIIDNHIYEQALGGNNAFFVANLGVLGHQHVRWQTQMDRIRPFYAVRCNSDPAVIEILAALGTGLVCTSKNEMMLVQNCGITPDNIIFTGGCKQPSHIKYAAKSGIEVLACDNETELRKIARCHPTAKVLLEVASAAQRDEVSMELGCTLKSCRHLLESARELGVRVVGVRFHVPHSCEDPAAYTHALSDARCVFDMGEEMGFNMKILDIGGGFSGSEAQLEQVDSAIRPLLDVYFPPQSGVRIIAEPGAYYVSSSFTLAVNIIAKTTVGWDAPGQHRDSLPPYKPEFLYYMNEGVYGSFASKLLDSTIPAPSVHKDSLALEEPLFPSSLWGPTCDGLDVVVERCLLPELSVGDWVVFDNMGVNTPAFTDAQRPPVYYTISADDWYELQETGFTQDGAMRNFLLLPPGF